MELDTLRVKNFRQFYDEQQIEFANDNQNVTVIHGSNGAGKSTLLNAFIWLFYEEIELSRPERIASERAMAELNIGQSVTVAVELTFTHEDQRYEARRTATFEKARENDLTGQKIDTNLSVEYTDGSGNWKRRSNPQNTLEQILPERLRDLFFFDGETIDQLTAIDSQDRVQMAIQNIMGIEILERAIRHLEHVENEFEDEVDEHASDELSELIAEKRQIKTELDDVTDRLEEVQSSRTEAKREIEEIDDRLRELEDSRELQQRRDRLQSELDDLEQEIKDINTDIAQEISDTGHLVFGLPAIEKTAEMLREKRQKGEIPSRIKSHFVEDLLDLEECICGRPLEAGTPARESVKQWQERAGSTQLEEQAMSIVGRLTEIGDMQEDLFEKLDTLLEQRSTARDNKQQTLEELDDIQDKLQEVETEDISQLESRRSQLIDKREEFAQEVGRLENQRDDLTDDLDDIEAKISDAREQSDLAEQARRRQLVAEHLRKKLEALFEQYQHEVRESINDRVNEIFRDIIAKDYYAKIDDDYSLLILKDVGQQEAVSVAKSTGERQVASLSFIASLVSLARERYEDDADATHFTGGIYPIVMDSPFGTLDPEYQKSVSKVMPEMANQVVVLVTQSQWSSAVEGELDTVSGRKYNLEYHNPSESDTIDYEYTVIREDTTRAEVAQ